jgi:hypothetical protein
LQPLNQSIIPIDHYSKNVDTINLQAFDLPLSSR